MSRSEESIVIGPMDVARATQPWQRKQRMMLAIAGAVFLVIACCAGYYWLAPGVPRIPRERMWVDTVRFGDFERMARGTGALEPKVQRWLTAQSSATVERIAAQPGTRVGANDVVLEMSNPELLDQLVNARTQLMAAQSDEMSKRLTLEGQMMDMESSLANLRADHDLSKLQTEKEAKLAEIKVVSGLQYLQTKRRLETLTEQLQISQRRLAGLRRNVAEQIESGKARIEQLRQMLVQRERQVDALRVRAGIDGVVQSIEATEGKQMAAGAPLGLIVQTSPLQARLNVPETQAKGLAVGMKAKIDLRSAAFIGHIARIAPSVQNASVEVLVEPDGELPPEARPSQAITGTIQIDRLTRVLTISRPPEARQDSTANLYRLDSNDRAERVSVRFGRASSDRIEVLGGLRQGDRVILSNLADWNNPPTFQLQ